MFERFVEWCARRLGLMVVLAVLMGGAGIYSLRKSPLDALPDLSDPQVIVFTEWMGRGPQLVEDQITYPLVARFISAPRVEAVRGFSMFGMSFVYVIFEEGTELYWARTRVQEYLGSARLPAGVVPTLGPDATALGWVFQYAVVDRTGQHDLQQLRAFQDFTLRYALAQVPGVAEVAAVGGYEKQYQVVVDPARLETFGVTLPEVVAAVRMSNQDVGGRVVEWAGREYVFRGLGRVAAPADLEQVVVRVGPGGVPVRVADVGRVELGPDIRRGLAEWNGEGEAVGGIVVMRQGANALDVIDGVKARLAEVSRPPGVEVEVAYDRSELIRGAVDTLREALTEELVAVLVFIALFLLHVRSALVAVVALPLAVLVSFIPTYFAGVTLNIMSLGGLIIAIGDMVDAVVVLIENAHRKIEEDQEDRARASEVDGTQGPMLRGRVPSTSDAPIPSGCRSRQSEGHRRTELVIEAAKELARPIFGSLLIIAVSFLPVFALEAQEGRLFRPLAYTKTFAMVAAAVLAVTVAPALMVAFIRGRIRPERANPLNRLAIWAYRPILAVALRGRLVVLALAVAATASIAWPLKRLGSEFMPPLDEGGFLFMPVTLPNIAIEEARRLLQIQDRVLMAIPEVETVLGKAGRAETATDPAPLSMFETTIVLKPRKAWRPGMTSERLAREIDAALQMPGLQNAVTMPIKARIDMLSTGIRTPVGVKVFGKDLAEIERLAREIEERLRPVPGTRSVYADRETGGSFLDFEPDRAALARYGLRVMDVLAVVETAIGGMVIDQVIEGRERYTVNVRYPRELRTDIAALERVLVPVPAPGGMAGMAGGGDPMAAPAPAATLATRVPLAQLGRFAVRSGPPMIKNEGGSLVGYVFIDTADDDLGGYVARAKEAVADLALPGGYHLQWTGQYEFLERVTNRLKYLIPLTLLLVVGLLWFEFGGLSLTLLVMSSVPFALIGSLWLLYGLGFHTSVAVWVGLIALVGVAAETASVMVIYLEQAYAQWAAAGRLRTPADLVPCALEGAVRRVRPLLMTVGMNLVGLAPVLVATGPGADVMKRIASPMVGGLITLLVMTLIVVPAAWVTWRRWGFRSAEGA